LKLSSSRLYLRGVRFSLPIVSGVRSHNHPTLVHQMEARPVPTIISFPITLIGSLPAPGKVVAVRSCRDAAEHARLLQRAGFFFLPDLKTGGLIFVTFYQSVANHVSKR
jgi:hypothetical protein